jgi:alpha-tubulin suppressor-like RCC1 family protein
VNSMGTNEDLIGFSYSNPTGYVSNLNGILQIEVGANHSCARAADQTVSCWGANNRGQLGHSIPMAHPTAPFREIYGSIRRVVDASGRLQNVDDLGLGDLHSCALVEGETYCWGDNNKRQLGHDVNTLYSVSPLKIVMPDH